MELLNERKSFDTKWNMVVFSPFKKNNFLFFLICFKKNNIFLFLVTIFHMICLRSQIKGQLCTFNIILI